uniref:(northern house mosquito) hypothetical protein n=1 Tax=Culex pipiens TaxID=7175 RepID=A0A8D8LB14_CULPI
MASFTLFRTVRSRGSLQLRRLPDSLLPRHRLPIAITVQNSLLASLQLHVDHPLPALLRCHAVVPLAILHKVPNNLIISQHFAVRLLLLQHQLTPGPGHCFSLIRRFLTLRRFFHHLRP